MFFDQNIYQYIPYKAKLVAYARENRKIATAAERKMWCFLRNKNFLGLKFTRQKPLGKFIADFYCAKLRLVIEVDGEIHRHQREYDKLRTQMLCEKYGVEVLRFGNEEVMNDMHLVHDRLVAWVQNPSRPSLLRERASECGLQKEAKLNRRTPPDKGERKGV